MASMKRNRSSITNRARRNWVLENTGNPDHPLYDEEDGVPQHDVVVGDYVKMNFALKDGSLSESMWVVVTGVNGRLFAGRIDARPAYVNAKRMQRINFVDGNIIAHEDCDGERKVIDYGHDLDLAA